MSRPDSRSDHNTQRVNAAVSIAAKRKASEAPDVDNRRGLEISIGRRIQGEHGAALRSLAESDPRLSVAELCEQVINPAEFAEPVLTPVFSGGRDAARLSQPNATPPAPVDFGTAWWATFVTAAAWFAGLSIAKAGMEAEPVGRVTEQIPVSDPEYASNIDTLRDAVGVGRGLGAAAKRARLDRGVA